MNKIINQKSLSAKLKSYKQNPLSAILLGFTIFSIVLTIFVFLVIVVYILVKGIPYLSTDLFSLTYTSENVSLLPALINTVIITFFSLIIATPIGIFSAIYLVEYAGRKNKFVDIIRTACETLSGIPSIIYGLFGFLFFVTTLGFRYSLIAGALTLSIMILPLIMRTTEEALKSVPDTYREGSFGLGAGKLRTVFSVVLPSAIPGILAGVILSIGRIVGETAALLYTAGTVAEIPNTIFDSTRTLSVHMYALQSEGLYTNQSFATATVLLVLVVGINTLSSVIARKFAKQ